MNSNSKDSLAVVSDSGAKRPLGFHKDIVKTHALRQPEHLVAIGLAVQPFDVEHGTEFVL